MAVETKSRTTILRMAGGLAALLAMPWFGLGPAAAQTYGSPAAVQLPPEVAGQMLAQLQPGSGVVPGYHRPQFGVLVAPPIVGYNPGAGVVLDARPTLLAPTPGAPVVVRRRYAAPVPRAVTVPPAPAVVARPAPVAATGREIDPRFLPQTVAYDGGQAPGTIVVDTRTKYLYLVQKNQRARRYGVGVGKEGFAWSGTHPISRKAEWPGWTPPAEMIARERRKGRILPTHMEGGPGNPLGARALYIGSTLYRIHGTNQPWTIGRAVSSGCIRMRNQDVEELYESVGVGTRVVVL